MTLELLGGCKECSLSFGKYDDLYLEKDSIIKVSLKDAKYSCAIGCGNPIPELEVEIKDKAFAIKESYFQLPSGTFNARRQTMSGYYSKSLNLVSIRDLLSKGLISYE